MGKVPDSANEIEFDCPNCGHTALLPVLGFPLAQTDHGIIFNGEYSAPSSIECRICRKRFEQDRG